MDDAVSIRSMREGLGLTRMQAGRARNVCPSTIERWEKSGTPRNFDRNRYQMLLNDFVQREFKPAGNLIFQKYPINFAGRLLGLTFSEFSSKYGLSVSYAKKFACNEREMPAKLIMRIEKDIKQHMLSLFEKSGS